MATYSDPSLIIPYGLDVDKPANPVEGSFYIATDTGIVYVCYVSGQWTNVSPDLLPYEKVLNTIAVTSTAKEYVEDFSSGSDIFFNVPTERNSNSNTYVKLAGMRVDIPPADYVLLQFSYRCSLGSNNGDFQLRKNGVTIREHLNFYGTGYVNSNPVLASVQAGDRFQLFGKRGNDSTSSNYVYAKDLRIIGTKRTMFIEDMS
jgi:hypothetical protein